MPTKGELLKDRYEILDLLSEEGGMGVVYLATDRSFNNTVVIKHSRYTDEHLRRIYSNLTAAQLRHLAETLRQAFEREARLLRELHHSALPPVIDYFTNGNDQQFFVMNFIPGKNLGELLVERNLTPFPLEDVLNWADQLLDALAYLHAQFDPPIIHRDIKPANLKLKPNGKIVLLDFGLAKGAAGEMSVVGSVLSGAGTPQYAPLEQMQSEGTDARSDLYSLAVTLYHLLTGQAPPYAFTRKMDVSDGKPDPLRPAHEANPQIPLEVSAVLQQAASLYPDARPATAAEMREALRRANQTEFIPNPGQPSGQPSEPTTINPPPTPKPTPTLKSLIDAINEENVGVVRDLLDRGVDIKALDEYGSSPLMTAVNKCSFTIVKMLLARGADLETKNNSGATALIAIMSRVDCSNLDRIAQALLDAGANVNAKDARDRTVLMQALIERKCSDKTIYDLLAKGANVNARDNKGETALMLCMETYWGVNVVKALIAKGADLEAKDYSGRTALMLAVAFDKSAMASVLLNAGAEVDVIDGENRTLLIKAVQSKIGLETVKDLLNRGLNVNAKDKQGKTALLLAANDRWLYDLEIVRALLDKGADVQARDNEGKTALLVAATRNGPEIVQALLENGADINARDNGGRTPLMLAATASPENVQVLLEKKADVNATDNRGWTALMLAEEKPNNDKIIEMLEMAGAK